MSNNALEILDNTHFLQIGGDNTTFTVKDRVFKTRKVKFRQKLKPNILRGNMAKELLNILTRWEHEKTRNKNG